MAKQLNWLSVEKTLREESVSLFTPQDLANLLGATEISLRFLLTRAVKRGYIIKLRRGLYALRAEPPSELEVANALYHPSYLSFTFALSFYHLIPESVYVVTSATSRKTAYFIALGRQFVYHRIKPAAFTGYRTERIQNRNIWIAEPEKAVVDTLYFVDLGKQGMPERINTQGLSKKRMRLFAKLFNRVSLLEAVEKML